MKISINRLFASLIALSFFLTIAPYQVSFAQSQTSVAPTQIVYHKNKYSTQDDIRLGRETAAQAERQLRIVRDPESSDYLERLGQRLVAAIPPEFQHPEFHYYFRLVDDRQINAFALPGGPMYVNTGAVLAAHNEGELAGVMAHELSHVALRHGTAQATKAQKYQVGAIAAAIAGTILAGPAAGELAGGSVGAYFLKYSREYETEADLLGARIMARAGYDPRDLANMFRTIEQTSGGGGGGFLSDHPSPSNRYQRINEEAARLPVSANPIKVTSEFRSVQERLRGYGGRYSNGGYYPNTPSGNYPSDNYPSNRSGNYPSDFPNGRVDSPASRSRSYSEFNLLRLDVPDNWREMQDQNSSVWFAPEGGYRAVNGTTVFTHGVNVGITQSRYRNLQQATNDFINSLQQGNSNLRSRSGFQRTNVDGRDALTITLDNVNEATSRPEIVSVVTTQLRNGELFYLIEVTPNNEYASYQNTFANILRSLRLND